MSRAAALLCCSVCMWALRAGAEAPRCRVAVDVEPARAVVGQQLVYSAQIQQRRDVTALSWEEPLRFPAFRVEWLPGLTGDAPLERDGESYQAFSERRALFPAHAGALRIPAAAIRCSTGSGEEIVRIPALEVAVDPVPSEGRPPAWRGLIGPVEVARSVSPDGVAVGGSLRVSVVVRGEANLWMANEPGDPLRGIGGVEVFARPPELSRDAGRRLGVRRYFAFDLVPHESGTLTLPPLRVPYFDPIRAVFDEARAPAIELEIAPPEPMPAPPAATPTPRPAPGPSGPGSGALVLVALLGGAVLWLVISRFRSTASPDAAPTARALLEEARRAAAQGDQDASLRAAERAVEEALAQREPGDGPANRAARALLEQLQRARYGQHANPPSLDQIQATLTTLDRT